MKTKQCSRRKEIKSIIEFHKRKNVKDGLSYWCKECFSKQHKLTYPSKKEKISEYHKKWYIENYDKLKDKRVLDKDKTKIRHRNYYIKNKAYVRAKNNEYDEKNKEKLKIASRNYYLKNKDYLSEKNNQWAKNNVEKVKVMKTKYYLTQKDTLNYKLSHNIRNVVWFSLKGNKKGKHWESLVGYTLQELIEHLENQFQEGMTWDNYGRNGWHIDHIIPRSLWEYEKSEDLEFKQCWCLANLQPMWAEDNRKKHNKCI